MKNNLFPVVILAGGLATRLHPITHTLPKSLVKINNKPFIHYQLELLRKNNIEKVVICTGFLGEQIINYVDNGHRFGLEVSYVSDGPILLGTAGALKQALATLSDNFFVLYGDSYLCCDYLAIQSAYLQQGKKALMTVLKNNEQWDKSNVLFSDNKIIIYDKKNKSPNMQHIDYGLGVFHKSAFDKITPFEKFDLADLYQDLLKQQQLASYLVHQRFYEIGSFTGLEELGEYLKNSRDILKRKNRWNLSNNFSMKPAKLLII